jgi:hypothetical protein
MNLLFHHAPPGAETCSAPSMEDIDAMGDMRARQAGQVAMRGQKTTNERNEKGRQNRPG